MRITIESTPQIVDLNGATCRVWNGTTADGTPCHVLVHGIGLAGDAAAADGFEKLQQLPPPAEALAETIVPSIRAQILHYWKMHERACREPNCQEKGNLLAFFAHSLGFSKQDVRNFESLLVRYDLNCPGDAACLHPANTEASHGS